MKLSIDDAERRFLEAPAPTRLEAFLRAHKDKLKPARVADEAEYSRQHLLNLRKGISQASRRCRRDILSAVRQLLSDDTIPMKALFDEGEDE